MELKDKISEIEEALDYRFENIDLLYQAFTRRSYSQEYGGENNEILEFVGDKAIDLAVIKELTDSYGRFADESKFFDKNHDWNDFSLKIRKNEGDFTKIKQEIVSNENLAKVVRQHNWQSMMFVGKADKKNNVVNQIKVQADLLEAIIGAVVLDCNYDMEAIQEAVCCVLNIDKHLAKVEDYGDEYPEKCKLETAINSLNLLYSRGLITEPQFLFEDEQVYQDGKYWWLCVCKAIDRNKHRKIEGARLGRSKTIAQNCAAYIALCEFYDVKPVELGD